MFGRVIISPHEPWQDEEKEKAEKDYSQWIKEMVWFCVWFCLTLTLTLTEIDT